LSTLFHKELVARDPRPPPGRPLSSASADAKALARRTSWWLPGDLTLSRSSPPGKKNFRGAARLRQIEVGYNPLPQVRRGVTACRHLRAVLPARSGSPVAHPQTRTGAAGSLRTHIFKHPFRAPYSAQCGDQDDFPGADRSGCGRRRPTWATRGSGRREPGGLRAASDFAGGLQTACRFRSRRNASRRRLFPPALLRPQPLRPQPLRPQRAADVPRPLPGNRRGSQAVAGPAPS